MASTGKPPRKDAEESEVSIDSQEEEEYDQDVYEQDSFLVDDQQSESQPSEDSKQKKKKKRKRHRSSYEDDLAEDDFEVIDELDRHNRKNKFTRLRNKQRDDDDPDELPNQANIDSMVDEGEQVEDEDLEDDEEQLDEDDDRHEHNNNIEDIFQPAGLEQVYINKEDELIVKADVPQRLQLKFKKRLDDKDLKDELPDQAKWIFERLKDKFDVHKHDRVKEKILKVLQLIRVELCEVMYIYHYRRLVYSPELNLEMLWKIYQYDEEWAVVKQLKRDLTYAAQFLKTLNMEVNPCVGKLLQEANDLKTLKLLKEHLDFELFRKKSDVKKKKMEVEGEAPKKKERKRLSAKANLIAEVEKQHDLVRAIKQDKFWLTPAQLYQNIQSRTQRFSPYTPQTTPNQQFQKFIDPKKPLFKDITLHRTITRYLELELLTYPQLRRWIRDRYIKYVVVSTVLTKKGEHDIGLYSKFYPAKRINKKPVSTFKGDLWLLLLEAEKEGLIKIQMTFEWQLNSSNLNFEQDPVYNDLIHYYFGNRSNDRQDKLLWARYRLQIIMGLLKDHIIPILHRQIKQDLYRQAEKDVISHCAAKFRAQLNKGPAIKRDGRPPTVLGLVIQHDKLGMAIVNSDGQLQFKGIIKITYESSIEFIVKDRVLNEHIDYYKPDLIVIAANCRQSIVLRKELRQVKQQRRPTRQQFCTLGQYDLCSLIAKRQIMKGSNEQRAILQAISLARLKLNGMAEILTMWSEKCQDNGVLFLNMHPLQKSVNQQKLKIELQRIAVEMVNLVGVDLNQLKDHPHLQNQLQFVCGLGPRKALNLLENLKKGVSGDKVIKRRRQLLNERLVGEIVYKNCSAFFKIITKYHLDYQQNLKKPSQKDQISLLDITRIHDEWYKTVSKACLVATSDTNRKKNLDEDQAIAEVMKNPNKLKSIQIDKNNPVDQQFICSQFACPFKDPRQPETPIDNKQIFYSIIRETPDTLKKFMVFSVKIISVSQHFVNVKIVENGLFGSIRLNSDNKTQFKKEGIIKAVITRFPFDPVEDKKRHHQPRHQTHQDQQLLKVEMALSFPHTTMKPHSCFPECYINLIHEIHPKIDMQYFQLKEEDIPVLEIKEQVRARTELRLINHPKFKNIGVTKAIDWVSTEPIGQFVIRPSSTGGKDYLIITWKFFEGVIAHVPVKIESKQMSGLNYQYKIEGSKDRIYNSFDEIIEHYIKPINRHMENVVANRKFLNLKPEQIEQKLKLDRQKDSSVIHYYFGCSPLMPEFVILLYMERSDKVIKEFIKIKDDGLAFHGERFPSLKDLIQWFKAHFKDRDYQKYVPKSSTIPPKK